jgi:hypothetical protein
MNTNEGMAQNCNRSQGLIPDRVIIIKKNFMYIIWMFSDLMKFYIEHLCII